MTGAVLAPNEAYLVERGLKTLEVRMQRHCESAMKVARYLETNDKVEKVFYPGLEDHEGHEIAKKQMHGLYGGMVSFIVKGCREKAAIVADCIHSIASIESVEKLEKVCAAQDKTLDILFQVNAGEEETKSGLDVHEAEAFLADLEKRAGAATADGKSENFPHLRFRGLMTIGKNTGVAEDSRECFAFLRALQQKFLAKGGAFAHFDQLSMGMTGDLEVAIEEGSTMIRVGTALFGERDYSK